MAVRVNLEFDADGFASRLARIDELTRAMNAKWALDQATWEPIDWSTF